MKKTATPHEQKLTLNDQLLLVKNTETFLLKKYRGTIHSNRIIDTGWKSFSFNYTVTDEMFMRCILCRMFRKKEDLNLLRNLCEEVETLVNSGIGDNNIIFSLTLIFNIGAKEFQSDIKALTKSFKFIEDVIFL